MDEVLRKFGFGDKWCKWIQVCLTSSRGSIIVNGSPTEEFQFGRGLKQGDLLSPFLFILIMESLHLSFQRIVDAGMFQGIKLGGGLVNLSHMFFADDAVFVGQWSETNIITLNHVLECFRKVSGLRINMSKSKILGVNVDSTLIHRAALKLGCLVLKIPFMYLGTIVGGNMSRIECWDAVVEKVKKRLSIWKMKTLSIGGRLTLVKSVLGSMPLYHMSLFKAPSGVLNRIEALRNRFFNGHECNSKKALWVNWKRALTSKDGGGLGISSLYAMNRGLLFKWVWRFFTQKQTLWSRVIQAIHGVNGKIGMSLSGRYKSCWLVIVQELNVLLNKGINVMQYLRRKIGNGEDTKFWEDKWCDGGMLKVRFHRLYALEDNKQITVGRKLAHTNLNDSFRRLPRSGIEMEQFVNMVNMLKDTGLSSSPDKWVWELEKSEEYSVSSTRNLIDEKMLPGADFQTRWNKWVPIKVNILTWKMMTNSLPTRFKISCRGILIDSILCGVCNKGVETTSHLFFSCPIARQVVSQILRWWFLDAVEWDSFEEWVDWVDSVRLPRKNKILLEGVFYVLWWILWSFRNKTLFDRKSPKKVSLFDDVVCMSFNWCRSRCKSRFGWDGWLKSPNLIMM